MNKFVIIQKRLKTHVFMNFQSHNINILIKDWLRILPFLPDTVLSICLY